MLYWLVHVETVEVMTAISPLLEEFVCVSVFLFISLFICTDRPDGRRHGHEYQCISCGGFLEKETSVSVCAFLS